MASQIIISDDEIDNASGASEIIISDDEIDNASGASEIIISDDEIDNASGASEIIISDDEIDNASGASEIIISDDEIDNASGASEIIISDDEIDDASGASEIIISDDEIDGASGADMNNISPGNGPGRHTTFSNFFDLYEACSHNTTENPIEIDNETNSNISVEADHGMFNNKSLIPTGNESDIEDTGLKASVNQIAVAQDSVANQQSLKRSMPSTPSGNGKASKRSRKKPSNGNPKSSPSTFSQVLGPPPVDAEDNQYSVDCLLDRRACPVDKNAVCFEYLVKWEGYGPEHNSWVKENDIHEDLIKAYTDGSP